MHLRYGVALAIVLGGILLARPDGPVPEASAEDDLHDLRSVVTVLETRVHDMEGRVRALLGLVERTNAGPVKSVEDLAIGLTRRTDAKSGHLVVEAGEFRVPARRPGDKVPSLEVFVRWIASRAPDGVITERLILATPWHPADTTRERVWPLDVPVELRIDGVSKRGEAHPAVARRGDQVQERLTLIFSPTTASRVKRATEVSVRVSTWDVPIRGSVLDLIRRGRVAIEGPDSK